MPLFRNDRIKVVNEIDALRAEVDNLTEAIKEHNALFEKLDEAMVPVAILREYNKNLVGFVSSLDTTQTAEDIVCSAIYYLKAYSGQV